MLERSEPCRLALDDSWRDGPVYFPGFTVAFDPMTTLRFGGRFSSDLCRVPFRIGGTNAEGVALIDTGAQALLVSKRFLDAHGLVEDPGETASVGGVGDEKPQRRPLVTLGISLLSNDGRRFTFTGICVVAPIPYCDLVLGYSTLALGVLAVDGPGGAWSWTIDPNLIPADRLAPGKPTRCRDA